jgi:hypothetical protein
LTGAIVSDQRPSLRRYDWLAGALATMISLLALGVSAYATYWQRQQTRAATWPRLQSGTSNIDGYAIFVDNVGAGPAEIRAAALTVDGKPVRTWKELITALAGQREKVDEHYSFSTLRGRVVAAGAHIAALQIKPGTTASAFAAAEERLHGSICYCSVLDECWVLSDAAHRAVRDCAREANTFDQ